MQEQKHDPTQRFHFEGLGDVWFVLTGGNPAQLLPQIMKTVISAGGTRPAWQWHKHKREYILMAWPQDQPVRAAVLMSGEQEQQLQPKTVLPLLEGLPNDLMVDKVHIWQQGCGANVATSVLQEQNPLWFYDPLYERDAEALTPGVTHTFLLSALAFSVRKALLDELTITSGLHFEQYAQAWLEAHPDQQRLDVPPLKVNVHNKHLILPGRHYCEYHIRATIEDVEACQLNKIPLKILYVSFPFEDRESIRLPIYVSQQTQGKMEFQPGQSIDAYIWLQGRIIDLDDSQRQKEES